MRRAPCGGAVQQAMKNLFEILELDDHASKVFPLLLGHPLQLRVSLVLLLQLRAEGPELGSVRRPRGI
eukprot:scaffold354_cov234-Pinguiococcus_pyrenoidosus.AAC.7